MDNNFNRYYVKCGMGNKDLVGWRKKSAINIHVLVIDIFDSLLSLSLSLELASKLS